MSRRNHKKRGVVLLVVLSLLTLFLVVGVLFVLVTGQYRRGAKSFAKRDAFETPPENLLDQTLYQIVRDSPFKTSLHGHSLLRDLYGNDGIRGAVRPQTPINNVAGGQFVEFAAVQDTRASQPFNRLLSREFQYYSGSVLTMTTGPARGMSTRIVGYTMVPGQDGAWGVAGQDDDGNTSNDGINERVWPIALPPNGSNFPGPYAQNDDLVVIRIEPFVNDQGLRILPNAEDAFLINGRPFNGTGMGYNPDPAVKNIEAVAWDPGQDARWGIAGTDDDANGTTDDATEAGWGGSDDVPDYVALLPHLGGHAIPTRYAADVGGADESYDVPDYENMFLAMVPPSVSAGQSARIIPSYHRPALIAYHVNNVRNLPTGPWNGWSRANPNYRDFRRKIVFRPMPWDHPNFSGTNTSMLGVWDRGPDGQWGVAGTDDDRDGVVDNYSEVGRLGSDDFVSNELALLGSLTTGPWDVDNDGDGVTDSIWIDVGFPVETAADGRRVKPLVAILVQDLDGRINLNAHGSIALFDLRPAGGPAVYSQIAGSGDTQLLPVAGPYAGNPNPFLPRGIGFGAADIHPGTAFFSTPAAAAEGLAVVQGRYASPTNAADIVPGRSNAIDDPLSYVKSQVTPNDYTAAYAGFGSHPDSRGIGAQGVDHTGQPLRQYMGLPGERLNDPYEILLGHNGSGDSGGFVTGSGDSPYMLTELERLLRYYDIDSGGLPDRLLALAPRSFNNQLLDPLGSKRRRNLVTTTSSYIPAIAASLPQQFRTAPAPLNPSNFVGNWNAGLDGQPGRRGRDDDRNGTIDDRSEFGWPGTDDSMDPVSIHDLYRAKLMARNSAVPGYADFIPRELSKMVPFEFLHGQRLDINRRLGNGRDDSMPPNDVVDEPAEAFNGEFAWPGAPAGPLPNYGTVAHNHKNDDGIVTADQRQTLARHLFCLMMLLVDEQFLNRNGPANREVEVRRIAQWAVNVVDFRDSDAIMTAFEYDADPFDSDGWNADGLLGPQLGPGLDGQWGIAGVDDDTNGTVDDFSEAGSGGSDDASDNMHSDRRVVWGMEYPGLLISELSAFHDRRVKDTNYDDGLQARRGIDPTNEDDDLDQYRIPQGSLFVEVYCPRNYRNNNIVLPQELYNAQGQLDLGRLAPERPTWPPMSGNPPLRYPVWRIAISEVHSETDPNDFSPHALATSMSRDEATFQPEQMLFSSAASQLPIQRIVWFTPLDPMGNPDEDRIFYSQFGALNTTVPPLVQMPSDVVLDPNHYAVLGPRPITYIGSTRVGPDGDPSTHDPSTHLVDLRNGRVLSTDNGVPPGSIWTYPVSTPPAAAGAGQIRFPRSLIVAAKPPRTWVNVNRRIGLNVSEPMPQSGAYYLEYNPMNEARIPPDAYSHHNPGLRTTLLPDEPFDYSNPELDAPVRTPNETVQTGTRFNYKSVFLQRLANPLLPWNPPPTTPAGVPDPNHIPNFPVNPYLTIDWSAVDLTVYSGEENVDQQVGPPGMMEWIDGQDPNPFVNDPPEHFSTRNKGSAGTKNIFGAITNQPGVTNVGGNIDNYFRHRYIHTLGFLNEVMGNPMTPAPGYEGAPDTPFPWFTFTNRPFANALELMMVPASAPGRFGMEFSVVPAAGVTNQYQNFSQDYGHLLNFFHTRNGAVPLPGARPDRTAAHFYQLFDYVETPSPFVGTEKWYNPAAFAVGNPAIGGLSIEARDPTDLFRPPFNRLSRFRDPGRINMNTIFDDRILEGVVKGFPAMDPTRAGTFANNLQASRGPVAASTITRFPNPFRSSSAADLAPPLGTLRQANPVDATMLRRRDLVTNEPLMSYTTAEYPMPPAYAGMYNDPDKNPYFRYQGLMRTGNMTSTNSNVFAVWLTVGYFQVEANPGGPDNGHPDGLRLGQELGAETGEIVRHRMFSIIDRSVPVAFEPGQNHNVDRAILLKRFIE